MMALGMSYDEYWNGDVRATRAFLEAEKLRRKKFNEQAHVLGAYVYEALCDASPLFLDLNRRRKPVPYRKEPFGMEEKEPEKADEEKLAENERLRATLFFKNWARAVGNTFK